MSEGRGFRITRAFFSLLELLNTDTRQRDEARDEEQTRERRGTIAIRDVHDRERVTLFGSLLSMTFPSQVGERVLVATLYDGTASIELRWPGRRSIPGLHVGEHIEVEGTAGMQGDHLVIFNPLYRIIAENT